MLSLCHLVRLTRQHVTISLCYEATTWCYKRLTKAGFILDMQDQLINPDIFPKANYRDALCPPIFPTIIICFTDFMTRVSRAKSFCGCYTFMGAVVKKTTSTDIRKKLVEANSDKRTNRQIHSSCRSSLGISTTNICAVTFLTTHTSATA